MERAGDLVKKAQKNLPKNSIGAVEDKLNSTFTFKGLLNSHLRLVRNWLILPAVKDLKPKAILFKKSI